MEDSCLICANVAFRALPMADGELLALTAREFLRGMRLMAGDSPELMGAVNPVPRKGVCMVERCARLVEASCGSCRGESCQRCVIAAELRDAENRLNGERDAEMRALGMDDDDLDEMVDKIAGSLCGEHAPFGTALLQEWYGKRDLMPAVSA